MAVAFDAASSSDVSSSGTSFTWEHTPAAAPSGVLVYTFTNADADNATAVTYSGASLTAVSGGRAVDTTGEPGDAKAWFLGAGVPDPQRINYESWTLETSGGTNLLRSIAYGNGYWVAVGDGGQVLYATDPTGTWSAATSGTTSNLSSVAYGNGYWVAIGASGVIRYRQTTPNGSWSGATSGITSGLNSVAYGNGYWVTVGNTGVIRYRATDPAGSWSGATSNTTVSLITIAYGGGYWVAAGLTVMRYRATDPAGSWSTQDSGSGNSVVFDGTTWLALAGGSTTTKYATDPTGTWTTGAALPGSPAAVNALFTDGTSWVASAGAAGACAYASSYAGPWTSFNTGSAGASSGFVSQAGTWAACHANLAADIYTTTDVRRAPVVVTRTDNSNEISAVALTVTAADDTEVAGTTLLQGDQTLSEQSISDGSTGVNSLRFAGVNSGLDAIDLSTTSTAANTLVRGANSTSAASFSFLGRYYMVSTTALSTTSSGTSIASGSTQSSTFVVAQTLIASGILAAIKTDTQNWVIQYTVSAMTTPYEMRLKLQRRNSSGTMQTESAYGTTRSATGTYTDTISWASGTFASTDQLALVWEHRRPSGTGNKSGTITAGGTSYVDAPRDKRVIGVVRETTAGQGSRSVGFQSTTSDDVAGVFLALREIYTVSSIPWTVGIPIR